MTKNEYIARLEAELYKRHIADAPDIISEYEQHFAFKLNDGYSEEEIAAKLGDPAELASQFEGTVQPQRAPGGKIMTIIGLCFADIFAGMTFIMLYAWELVMGASAIAFAGCAVCLFGNINIYSLIPPMPYWCGAVFALALAAFAVLAAVGCVYFAAFIKQMMRSYGRFRSNALAAASGRATLPSLTISPRLTPRMNRRLRTVALLALVIFVACFVLGVVVSMLSAGSFEFWHTWSWFVS